MTIKEIIDNYLALGYSFENVSAKTCQDIVLLKIANSKFRENITIKGGVVMHSISDNLRRATRDLDLDFIKYSLDDESIYEFIKVLNNINDGINIEIIGNIRKLHQQDYDGKRVNIKLKDALGTELKTKLDIGVEKNFDIEQDEFCFNINVIKKSAKLLINSKEQIFTEKLKSLLKLGLRSTRYKDLFDFYYLITNTNLNSKKICLCIDSLIINNDKMKENSIEDIISRLKLTLNSTKFKKNLDNSKVNWLDTDIEEAIKTVLNYLKKLN